MLTKEIAERPEFSLCTAGMALSLHATSPDLILILCPEPWAQGLIPEHIQNMR